MPSQNKIICSRCKTPKGTTNVRYEKLVKQYGSVEKLEKFYVCRDCKSGGVINPAAGKTPTKGKKGKKKKLPKSKVICSKCNGKFGTTKTRLAKLISQYGSLEELHTTYVCRSCRKELNVDKRGRVKPPKRKRRKSVLPKKDGVAQLPEWMKDISKVFPPKTERRLLTAEELKKSNVCWRPDYWADHKYCNGCPCDARGACGCTTKVFVKENKLDKVKKIAKVKKTKKKK